MREFPLVRRPTTWESFFGIRRESAAIVFSGVDRPRTVDVGFVTKRTIADTVIVSVED